MNKQAKTKLCDIGHLTLIFAYIYFTLLAITIKWEYIHFNIIYEIISFLIFVVVIMFGVLGLFFFVPDIIKGMIIRYKIIKPQLPLIKSVKNIKVSLVGIIKLYNLKVDMYYRIYNNNANSHYKPLEHNIQNTNNIYYNIQYIARSCDRIENVKKSDELDQKSSLDIKQEIFKAEEKKTQEKETLIRESLDYTILEFSKFLTETEVDLIQRALHNFLIDKPYKLDSKISINERIGKYDLYNYGWTIWNHLKEIGILNKAVAKFLINVFFLKDDPTEESIISNWTKRANSPKMALAKDISAYLQSEINN